MSEGTRERWVLLLLPPPYSYSSAWLTASKGASRVEGGGGSAVEYGSGGQHRVCTALTLRTEKGGQEGSGAGGATSGALIATSLLGYPGYISSGTFSVAGPTAVPPTLEEPLLAAS